MRNQHSRFLAVTFLAAAMASLPSANAQQVPVAGMGQHIVARNVLGISCTNTFPGGMSNLTSHATAVLYFPYIAGVPDQYLFSTPSKRYRMKSTHFSLRCFPVLRLGKPTTGV